MYSTVQTCVYTCTVYNFFKLSLYNTHNNSLTELGVRSLREDGVIRSQLQSILLAQQGPGSSEEEKQEGQRFGNEHYMIVLSLWFICVCIHVQLYMYM